MILKGFIEANELGKIFYTRAGWLKQRSNDSTWVTQKEKSAAVCSSIWGSSFLIWRSG